MKTNICSAQDELQQGEIEVRSQNIYSPYVISLEFFMNAKAMHLYWLNQLYICAYISFS
jgi:hypothetical protein